MSSKNISISQEAYERLAAWKATGQSFSGAILDLLQQDEKKKIYDYIPKKDGEKEEIMKNRGK